MQEIIISENVTNIVDAKKIIDSISEIDNKIKESKQTAEVLIKSVYDSSESLQKAKNDDSFIKRFWGWKTETLFEFIVESRNVTHTSVSTISKLIQNNNDNSKLLAEMISKLVLLSVMSFKNNSEITAQLEEMAINFEQSSTGNTEQASQIKRIILAHINKIKEEKNKADNIEFNFGIINANLKKLNDKLDAINNDIDNEKQKINNLEVKVNNQEASNLSFIDSQKQLMSVNMRGAENFTDNPQNNYAFEERISRLEKTSMLDKNSKLIFGGFIFLTIIILALVSFILFKL